MKVRIHLWLKLLFYNYEKHSFCSSQQDVIKLIPATELIKAGIMLKIMKNNLGNYLTISQLYSSNYVQAMIM